MLPFVAILIVLAVILERIGRPTAAAAASPFASHGLGLGALYLLFAVITLIFVGWPA